METPCPHCAKPRAICVCDRIVTHETRTAVLVLQHPQEPDRSLGTAALVALSLPRAELRVGLSWASLSHCLGREVPNAAWGVLYPASLRKPLSPEDAARPYLVLDRAGDPREDRSPLRGLVALDGTWSQAKALWWRNPWLLKLPRVLLRPAEPSIYGRLRKEPRREYVSTLEAVAEALVGNGEDPALRADLRRVLRTMVQRARDAGRLHP